MNRYRILKKKGTTEKYITRYIVQEYKQNPEIYKNEDCIKYLKDEGFPVAGSYLYGIETYIYIDLKEFDCLDQARRFKRSLELEDGIVIE